MGGFEGIYRWKYSVRVSPPLLKGVGGMKSRGRGIRGYRDIPPAPLKRGDRGGGVGGFEDFYWGEYNERASPPLLKGAGGMKKEGEEVETYPQPLKRGEFAVAAWEDSEMFIEGI